MYYNVVVKSEINSYDGNSLVFHFEDNFDEALKFVKHILEISNYHVEILQFYKEEE